MNKTRTSERIEVTLLAFVVVGRLVRISGLVRLHQPELRIAHPPELAVSPLDGPPLIAMGTHVLPNGELTWVSWDFARPQSVLVVYQGYVERLDLAYRSGGRGEVIGHGPWVFNFRLPCPRTAWSRSKTTGTGLRHLDA